MSQIKNIIVSIIVLVIIYFFVQTATSMGAPIIFKLVAGLMVVMIFINIARGLIRRY